MTINPLQWHHQDEKKKSAHGGKRQQKHNNAKGAVSTVLKTL